jgi:phosphotriesterase-related protein
VRILKEEGVDLNLVYIGHSNDDTDVGYLTGLLDEGVWLGLDRYPGGRTPETPRWESRTEVVKQLIDAGWAHRLMLSHDHSTPVVQPSEELRREREAFNPDGYLFITRNVLPRLLELGATQADVDAIMVNNPRNFFTD